MPWNCHATMFMWPCSKKDCLGIPNSVLLCICITLVVFTIRLQQWCKTVSQQSNIPKVCRGLSRGRVCSITPYHLLDVGTSIPDKAGYANVDTAVSRTPHWRTRRRCRYAGLANCCQPFLRPLFAPEGWELRLVFKEGSAPVWLRGKEALWHDAPSPRALWHSSAAGDGLLA